MALKTQKDKWRANLKWRFVVRRFLHAPVAAFAGTAVAAGGCTDEDDVEAAVVEWDGAALAGPGVAELLDPPSTRSEIGGPGKVYFAPGVKA